MKDLPGSSRGGGVGCWRTLGEGGKLFGDCQLQLSCDMETEGSARSILLETRTIILWLYRLCMTDAARNSISHISISVCCGDALGIGLNHLLQ